MEQLILRCQSDLNMYIRDEMLMHTPPTKAAPARLFCFFGAKGRGQ